MSFLFFCIILFFSFLSLFWLYYVYCYGRPALMGDCLHWQPAIAVIICAVAWVTYVFIVVLYTWHIVSTVKLVWRQHSINSIFGERRISYFFTAKTQRWAKPMSVCLSARSHILKTTWLNFTKLSTHVRLTVAVARYSSDGVAISHVLPVLRMAPFFHKMGPMTRRLYS